MKKPKSKKLTQEDLDAISSNPEELNSIAQPFLDKVNELCFQGDFSAAAKVFENMLKKAAENIDE